MKRSHVIIALVIAGLLVAVSYEAVLIWFEPQQGSAVIDPSKEIQAACNYLVSNYNSTLGLVAETPAHQRYWLYSDNLLVSIALSEDCTHSAIVQTILSNVSDALSKYQYPNQYLVLKSKTWDFNASKNYQIFNSVRATISNQTGILSPDHYADIAFLQAFYFAKWASDKTQADSLFDDAVAMYNGTGFIDKPFQSQMQFQTYKLALYIYVARIINRPIQLSALVTLGRMQDSNGGFHTGYASDFSTDDTSTNTETTSLALLALHSLAP